MPTQVQLRRGTTSQNESFTGAVGEISVDTTLDTIRVHDGSTAGGYRLAKYSEIQAGDITGVTAGTGLSGGGTSGGVTVNLSHLGIESLSDPNDDQIIFWDDSAGATAFLDLGTGLSISGTTISVGTLNQDTTGTADLITATANNSTDETVYPVFVDGATGSQGVETDTGFTYNPSDGDLTIGGALVSATLDISGNADIDGTLEADAYTVDGTALNEYIADTVGAMTTSNTESGITVAYDDSDNTLDFTVGTLNQNTTGTAAAWTTARTLSFTGDVTGTGSVDGSANVATALTIAANSVALGTDTTGNYMTDASAGTGVTVSHTPAEGSTATISIGQAVATTSDVTFGDVTVSGDLTVSGDTTTVNTATLSVEDPLIVLASGNNAADAVDIGLYGLYDTSGSQDLYGGLFRDANDSGKWKLFKDNQAAPTTTVNTSGTGYAVATLVANLEGDVTGDVTGNVSGSSGSTTGNAATVTNGVYTTGAQTIAGVKTFSSAIVSDLTGDVTGDLTGTATLATSITASANNSTDEDTYLTFVDGATGTQGLETDTGLTYNPSSGNLTIGGALTGASLDISGSADIDGTLEADAYTVDGTALAEYIADTVGAMVSSNTETGIAVTYEDGDNTLDFVVADVALGSGTTGNYMAQVSGGDGITVSHTQGEGSTATITGTAIYNASGTKLN